MSLKIANFHPPFLLVDGSSFLFRAYHALPPLSNSKDMPTGAIKGVLSMLKKLIESYQPSHIGVIFDPKGKTTRHQTYPQYKENRPPAPEELACQIAPLKDAIKAMGIAVYTLNGIEADDVLGTLAHQTSTLELETLIATGDKDLAQLVNEYINLINTMNDSRLDQQGIIEKYAVKPNQIIDYLALLGDKVDNIPGIPGVGKKTACQLLEHFHTIEELYKNLEQLPQLKIRGAKKLADKLLEHIDDLKLAQRLVTIDCLLDLPFKLTDLQLKPIQKEQLAAIFNELEFKTWLQEVESGSFLQNDPSQQNNFQPPPPNTLKKYETITDQKSLQQWIEQLKTASLMAIDTETNSLDYVSADLVGISFATNDHEAAYIPLSHLTETDSEEDNDINQLDPNQLKLEWVLEQLKPILSDPNIYKVGQNLKFDQSIFARYQLELKGICHDTMLESYILNTTANRHDLDTLAEKHLDYKTTKFTDIAGKGSKQKTFDQIPIATASHYAAEDADITLQLHNKLWPLLKQKPRLTDIYQNIEIPLLSILSKMERTGALVDANHLEAQSERLAKQLHQLSEEAYELAGCQFNLNSTQQLGDILYNTLNLPIIKKTPKGAPSTAEPVLQELALEYPLPKVILTYRTLNKLKTTYTDKLPQQIHPISGRVHTSYHQAVTATGRLSSSDPNLQNIPIRTEEGRQIRQAFIAAPNHLLVAADYSQIELRIMAHLSEDSALLKAFRNNQDIHQATAADLFHVAIEDVTADQRRNAKSINFGLLYGMSAFGLARQLNVSLAQAKSFIEHYFKQFPGVKKFMEHIKQTAHDQQYVETLFGRRLYLNEINSPNKLRQQAAERTAINAPMQGTAADIIKRAMIRVDQWLTDTRLTAKVILQVHDELVLEVPQDELDLVTAGLIEQMEGSAELNVPLTVNISHGKNWDETHH